MADNIAVTAGAGTNVVASEVTYSGDTAKLQGVELMTVAGSENSRVATQVNTANPLPVDAAEPYNAFTEFTRPNNATDYAANDVISTSGGYMVPFTSIATVAGGRGNVLVAYCIQKSYTSTIPQLFMVLFSGTVAPTAIVDNLGAAYTHAEMENFATVLDFANRQVIYDGGGTPANGIILHWTDPLYLPYVCGTGVSTLWGQPQTKAAFTPVANSVWRFGLGAAMKRGA